MRDNDKGNAIDGLTDHAFSPAEEWNRFYSESKMDMLEIYIQHQLEHFNIIPEQTGNDALLIDIFKHMLEYIKELRKRLLT